MLNKFLFLQFFIYILCNILLINNSELDYHYHYHSDSDSNINTLENIQIPIRRVLIDMNNNIYFTN